VSLTVLTVLELTSALMKHYLAGAEIFVHGWLSDQMSTDDRLCLAILLVLIRATLNVCICAGVMDTMNASLHI